MERTSIEINPPQKDLELWHDAIEGGDPFSWDFVSGTESKPINVKESESGDQSPAAGHHSSSLHNRRIMSSETRGLCWAFAFVCVCVIIGLLVASLKKVPSTEMGVQYNIHKKQLEDATKSGGLFLGPPGFKFIKFPSTFITVGFNDRTCVSNDGLLVTFSVTFQVRYYYISSHYASHFALITASIFFL